MEAQKQLAIEQHSLQADTFAERYRSADIYHSCFNYSRHRLDALLERYLPERGDGLSLLDVGCGTGNHMARLRERGFQVAGVDGSESMLEHARANNPGAEIHRADVEAIPFADASFDFVLCIEVLRYLPDAAACVREMARVLRPGGVALVTAAPVFNLNGYSVINRVANLVKLGDLVRLKQFFTTSRKLRRQFVEAGFEKPAIHGVYIGPVNWIERLAPRMLPRALKAWEKIDSAVADRAVLREFSNMFLARAVRKR
ncbi:MAG TPA: class I SAM-dependent methyltransferase [Blastocatellia bacterium]|nr:class I SAM-dependent methyltransferase [Blastocatellia bacterium]